MAKLYLGQQPSCRRIFKLQNLIKFATKMKTTIDQNFFKKHKKFPDSSILVPNSDYSHLYYVCWNTLYKQLITTNFGFIVYQGIFLVLFVKYSWLVPMNVRQGKSFQWCTNFLYCSVLSLGSNVNTRVGVSQPDMGSIFQIKNQWYILVIGIYILYKLSKFKKKICYSIVIVY